MSFEAKLNHNVTSRTHWRALNVHTSVKEFDFMCNKLGLALISRILLKLLQTVNLRNAVNLEDGPFFFFLLSPAIMRHCSIPDYELLYESSVQSERQTDI
jgi:hypothetical protein